jgi:hypothetical protein
MIPAVILTGNRMRSRHTAIPIGHKQQQRVTSERVIELNPANVEARKNLGMTYAELRETDNHKAYGVASESPALRPEGNPLGGQLPGNNTHWYNWFVLPPAAVWPAAFCFLLRCACHNRIP